MSPALTLSPALTFTVVTRPIAENESCASLIGIMTAAADTELPLSDWLAFDGLLLSPNVIVGMGVGEEAADVHADSRTSAITVMINKTCFILAL